MKRKRIEKLMARLERGLNKSNEILDAIDYDGWQEPVDGETDGWTVMDLVVHFIVSEEHLLMIAKDIAVGGEGVSEDIDIDAFNEDQLARQPDRTPDELQALLGDVRETTIAWVTEQDDETLDRVGRHPTLGESSVETIIFSIYAHQLLHMRELAPKLK
ncbi:MAG: DinB family protein [Anaerolineales bacterium]|jgi:hypothetical protein